MWDKITVRKITLDQRAKTLGRAGHFTGGGAGGGDSATQRENGTREDGEWEPGGERRRW